MIKRIVQLTLEPEFIEEFKVFFEARKATINSFEGCTFLELWQDVQELLVLVLVVLVVLEVLV
jgi:hypothetical protein